MRNALFTALSFWILAASAQTNEPNRMPEEKVRKKVVEKFKAQHPQVSGQVWYPYPNRYWKNEQGATPMYFPILWTNHVPDYYEVRFSDDKGKIRKVYDRTGVIQVTSREVEAFALPEQAKGLLTEKGYSDWSLIKIERLTKAGVQGSYFKVWLNQGKKNRILFFDQEGKLVKTMTFDNDLNFAANANAKLKQAPGSRNHKVVDEDNVPVVVKNKVRKNHVNVSIIEWSEHTRFYDPFATGDTRSYYDLTLPVFYQAVLDSKSGKYRATYSSYGDLLEIAEVISKKELPKTIRSEMKAKLYQDWKFDKEHDRIERENGRFIYRIYATSDGEPRIILLNDQGTYGLF